MVPREKLARDRARELARQLGLFGLPISMIDVCAAINVPVTWDARVPVKDDAVTLCYKGEYIIFLKESLTTPARMRFTLAHEVGHIRMKHFEEHDLRFCMCSRLGRGTAWQLNREANIFAEEFLMPEEFILREFWRGADYLQSACGVSKEAMMIRLRGLGLILDEQISAK